MSDQPKWISEDTSTSILEWTNFLHTEAKRLFKQDGTHGNMLFSFDKDKGLVSVNLIPPDTDHDQVNETIVNVVNEHNLYGMIFIGETWMYKIKENDHTAFQLLDGEMKVSELNDEDKKEALVIMMESRDGDCLICLDEIIRRGDSSTLKEGKLNKSAQQKWFIGQNHY